MSEDQVIPLPVDQFDGPEGQKDDPRDRNGVMVPSMDLLLNVPMRVTVELGRARLPLKNLLQLAQGSVVELDKILGEPLTLYVNGEPIAAGEAVLVNQERFGLRLTSIISPEDRLRLKDHPELG